MYYILSLKHTHKHNKFMTFWRPNNAGYCYSKENAGSYEELAKGYVNGGSLLLVHEDLANKLFVPGKEDPDATDPHRPTGSLVPNTLKNRRILGVHYKNKELELITALKNE